MASNCISQQDFEAVRDEVLGMPARFDCLTRVTENLLRPYVNRHTSHVKSDPNFANDIMQDIQLKMIVTIVTHFFMRDGDEGEEKNALGLTRWMYTVARNTTITALTKSSQRVPVSLVQENDDEEEYVIPICDDKADRQPGVLLEMREAVSKCFNSAIESSSAGHIVLTHLMISLLSLENGGNRIEAERLFAKSFADKSLDDILDSFRAGIKRKPWLDISNVQLNRFKEKLDEPINGQRSGEYPLKDFAMKKGLESSLSDWLHRMDGRIQKAFGESYFSDSAPSWSMNNTR
ncbi:MAG: hypothetical protein IJD13_01075 [Oscillospiraceae bacterium]|nr:hypothetical protein [Oscillospiraceae bacterium]